MNTTEKPLSQESSEALAVAFRAREQARFWLQENNIDPAFKNIQVTVTVDQSGTTIETRIENA